MNELFRKFAHRTSAAVGSPWAFAIAIGTLVVWALLGPLFRYSDSWQLVINTATSVITFLMVFVIQNTQNRDAKAIHLKLDELLRAVRAARTSMVDLEESTEEELQELQEQFRKLRARYRVKRVEVDEAEPKQQSESRGRHSQRPRRRKPT